MIMRNEYYFLSNMYPCQITYNGHTFKSSESAFQAQKDISRVSEFEALDGRDAKRLGRKVKMRPDWESVKLNIMEEILRIKFSNSILAEKLKAVKGPIVEENTWHDTYWGVCNGIGENHHGKLLEKIRADLLKEGANNG
ncbi:MAG: NADAR family protein [Oscillospiraceae bacterium]|nr:NADAR family protein [Oscillospiraceae bacterium]